MLEWQIKPLSKKSSKSGRDIKAGDTVVCAVFLDSMGNLERRDFLKDEFDESVLAAGFVGRWERVVGENPEEDERAARKIAMASTEDFFLSLCDENSPVEADEVDALKQILSLLLERKRILKPLGRPSGGVQKYLHPASGKVFDVPQKEPSEDMILKLGSQLGAIIV